jgi:translocation and assembly module TamA
VLFRSYKLEASGTFTNAGYLSSVTAQSLRFRLEKLWNIGSFMPPIWILGIRGGFSTTFTDEVISTSTLLPAGTPFRHFLGGSRDLRGFFLRELPEGGKGALTSAFLGIESRFPYLLPWHLEPLLFLDAGTTGSFSLQIDKVIYWGPGFGLRWESDFGVFRLTLAHGFSGPTGNPLSHWQPFFSFGEEF